MTKTMSDDKPPTEHSFGQLNKNRRSVLKGIGTGIGLTALGGLSVGTVSAQDLDDLCEAIPHDIVLVLDRSGSMGVDPDGDGNSKLDDVKAAATGFVDRLTSSDRVGLVSFNQNPASDVALTDDFSTVKSTINGLSAGGATNIGGATDLAHDQLNTNGRSGVDPILVLLSNGAHNTGPAPGPEADEAKADGIRVITIAFGTGADDATLKEMASDPKASNFFDAPTGADIDSVFQTITQEICPTEVDIDIKPGSDPNAINCNPDREGVIPVAILSDEGFDATTVDPSSLRFGSPSTVVDGNGATLAHPGGHLEDVDNDGDTDFVGHFPVKDAGFSDSDTEGWLVGTTMDGEDIAGRDSVKIVGNCRSKKNH